MAELYAYTPQVWNYYGQWQCMSQSALIRQNPIGSMHMSGWITMRHNACIVNMPGMDLDLLISKSEMDFLHECLYTQLSCWASGLVFISRHAKMMVPHDITLYYVSDSASGPMPTQRLGRMLADNINFNALQHMWSKLLSLDNRSSRPSRALHPLTNMRLPLSYSDETRWEVCLAYVFVTHVLAQIKTNSFSFMGSSQCLLGHSKYVYDYCCRSCVHTNQASQSDACVPKGCVIMTRNAQSLLLVVRGCCIATLQTNDQALLVIPKEALPAMRNTLSRMNVYYVLCREDAKFFDRSHRIVVVTTQILKHLSGITDKKWERIIMFDWHQVWKHLSHQFYSSTGFFIEHHLQIVLMLVEDSLGSTRYPPNTLTELAAALGVPELSLGMPGRTKELMYERILSIDNDVTYAQSKVQLYSVLTVSHPSADEVSESKKHIGHRATLVAHLGSLAHDRGSMAILRSTQTPQMFFEKKSSKRPITAFAQTSFTCSPQERHCGICMHEVPSALTRCGHWFCVYCIAKSTSLGNNQCPLCRSSIQEKSDIVIIDPQKCIHTRFFESLTEVLQSRCKEPHVKILVLCSYGNNMERVASALRFKGLRSVSWSGNTKQLEKNLSLFTESEQCVMFCDTEFLSFRWIGKLDFVTEILCILPLDTENRELCCQVKEALSVTNKAPVFFVWDGESSHLPQEKPTCEPTDTCMCPILIQSRTALQHTNVNNNTSTAR